MRGLDGLCLSQIWGGSISRARFNGYGEAKTGPFAPMTV